MRYLLIDSQNMFHRSTHVARGDAYMRGGMALHIMLTSIAQAWRLFDADHVVVALECRTRNNWRQAFDDRYKLNRQETRDALTEKEREENEILFGILNDYLEFVKDHTNATVLQCPVAEADDMIARWIEVHPDDEHIIISTDKDFQQLLATNVVQYNGVSKKVLITEDSPLHKNIEGRLPKDFKEEIVEDPEYLLFEKIVRGDPGDNVFSAYPGVRKKAGRGKPSIYTAFEDRFDQGYDWNNFMMQKWTDHLGEDHLVRDDFERNKMLIDLKAHPDEVKEAMDVVIDEAKEAEPKKKIGFHFLQFCEQHELQHISERVTEFANIFASQCKEEENV